MPAVCLMLASTAILDDGSKTRARWRDDVAAFPSKQSPDCPSTILVATGRDASYDLTSLHDGVRFDFDGDGTAERTSWTSPNSQIAFLAIDRDKNGAITSGDELVGKHTWPGARSGFAALAELYEQTNGKPKGATVPSDEPGLSELLLWTDRNHDGRSDPSELNQLADHVASVNLGYSGYHRSDVHGNEFAYRAFVLVRATPDRNRAETRYEGMTLLRHVYDVCFVRP